MNRIVIKVGTKVLTKEDGALDTDMVRRVVEQIVSLRKDGTQVVLVTSGAMGAGKSLLTLADTLAETVQKQVFAAVGQVKLMNMYAEFFAEHDFLCAQVLATKEDFRDEVHYKNMQNCFEGLLLDNVVPIVNENDVVATTELLFTDNDELAGLVATQLSANKLIILTTTDGVLDKYGSTIPEITAQNMGEAAQYITPDKSTGGRGGMASKFTVASNLAEKGIEVSIVNGKKEHAVTDAIAGRAAGTVFSPKATQV